MEHEYCWCSHQRASHVNGVCATCLEFNLSPNSHEFKADESRVNPRVRPLLESERRASVPNPVGVYAEEWGQLSLVSVDDLPALEVAPPRVVPDVLPTPDDHRVIFLVFSGEYEDRRLVTPFVGNRYAATMFCAEFDRYAREEEKSELEQHLDCAASWSEFVPRQYPDFYTRVTYRTIARLGRHPRLFHEVSVEVLPYPDSGSLDNCRAVSVNSLDNHLEVTSWAPDSQNDLIRTMHADRVNEWLKSEAHK